MFVCFRSKNKVEIKLHVILRIYWTPCIFNRDKYDYYVDLKIDFVHRPFDEKGNQDNSINQIYDFADVMNIGTEPFQNRPEKYKKFYYDDSGKIIKSEAKWLREITFENVWDRHSCKVFSSFAFDSSKGYLGNSQIFYHTLKYFKLKSTDQQFWGRVLFRATQQHPCLLAFK